MSSAVDTRFGSMRSSKWLEFCHPPRRSSGFADGRPPEATNGRFVEAKREESRAAVGQLWGGPSGRCGSASDSRVSDLTAAKLTFKLSDRIADVRGRPWPTLSGCSPSRMVCLTAVDRFVATYFDRLLLHQWSVACRSTSILPNDANITTSSKTKPLRLITACHS